MKKIFVLTAFLCAAATMVSAQKYGHLNLGELISSMPATESANKELEAYQQQLVSQGEDMAKKFQEAYGNFVTSVQGGDMTPKQQQEAQAALQEKQQEIMAYEKEIQEKVQQKRSELLEPIFAQAEEAIAAVAKENGYKLIFDTSVFNSVLFASESEDVIGPVKAKLGLE